MAGYVNVPFDGMPEAPEPRAPKRRTRPSPDKITWSRYRPARAVVCTQCAANGLAARQWLPFEYATHRRTQGGKTDLLCYTHAQQQRAADHLGPLKGRGQ